MIFKCLSSVIKSHDWIGHKDHKTWRHAFELILEVMDPSLPFAEEENSWCEREVHETEERGYEYHTFMFDYINREIVGYQSTAHNQILDLLER